MITIAIVFVFIPAVLFTVVFLLSAFRVSSKSDDAAGYERK